MTRTSSIFSSVVLLSMHPWRGGGAPGGIGVTGCVTTTSSGGGGGGSGSTLKDRHVNVSLQASGQ